MPDSPRPVRPSPPSPAIAGRFLYLRPCPDVPDLPRQPDCLRQARPCLFSDSRFPFSRSLTGLAVSGHHPFPDGLTVPGHAGYCLPCPAVFLPAATFHAVPFRASAPPRPFRASSLPCLSPFELQPRSFRACKSSCRTLGLQRRIFPILPILFRIRKTMFGGNRPGEPLTAQGPEAGGSTDAPSFLGTGAAHGDGSRSRVRAVRWEPSAGSRPGEVVREELPAGTASRNRSAGEAGGMNALLLDGPAFASSCMKRGETFRCPARPDSGPALRDERPCGMLRLWGTGTGRSCFPLFPTPF